MNAVDMEGNSNSHSSVHSKENGKKLI